MRQDKHRRHPWRKYRIGIHSEPIRTIPIHSDICIRANANHSERIRKTFCNSFDEKSRLFRFIPISVSESMRIIPKTFEKRFVTRLMKNDKKSIRMNPKPCFQSESIRARIDPNRISNQN